VSQMFRRAGLRLEAQRLTYRRDCQPLLRDRCLTSETLTAEDLGLSIVTYLDVTIWEVIRDQFACNNVADAKSVTHKAIFCLIRVSRRFVHNILGRAQLRVTEQTRHGAPMALGSWNTAERDAGSNASTPEGISG
jgi:hypothetical protein